MESCPAYGYHRNPPTHRFQYGELGKILEEYQELLDASNQSNKILMLCELADIVGAIQGYLNAEFPGFTLQDLITMADATERAFLRGER